MMFERRLEAFYTVTPYIAEFWNTLSNLPFIIIGLLRLLETPKDPSLIPIPSASLFYLCMISIGIGSGIHHATPARWTIIIDWIPIGMTSFYFLPWVSQVSLTALFQVCLALFVLFTDHVHQTVPVPWGHVFWHILAAFAMDSAFQSLSQ